MYLLKFYFFLIVEYSNINYIINIFLWSENLLFCMCKVHSHLQWIQLKNYLIYNNGESFFISLNFHYFSSNCNLQNKQLIKRKEGSNSACLFCFNDFQILVHIKVWSSFSLISAFSFVTTYILMYKLNF